MARLSPTLVALSELQERIRTIETETEHQKAEVLLERLQRLETQLKGWERRLVTEEERLVYQQSETLLTHVREDLMVLRQILEVSENTNLLAPLSPSNLIPDQLQRIESLHRPVPVARQLRDIYQELKRVNETYHSPLCRLVLGHQNQYTTARHHRPDVQNHNASCVSQACMAIEWLSDAFLAGREVHDNHLDEIMGSAVERHVRAVQRLGLTADTNLTTHDVQRGGQFPRMVFGEEREPIVARSSIELHNLFANYVVAGLALVAQKPVRQGLGSMIMIKGAEASALMYHIDQQGKEKYFHFDSHGSHDITGSTHGYLICFPSRGAFVEYLDKRYTFVDVDGDLYEHTQGLFQMNYNAVELREVSMRP